MAQQQTEEQLHELACIKAKWTPLEGLSRPRTVIVENDTADVVRIGWTLDAQGNPVAACRLKPGERRNFGFAVGWGPSALYAFTDEAGTLWVEESQHERAVIEAANPGQAPQPKRKTAAIFKLPAPAATDFTTVHAAHNAAAGVVWPAPVGALPEPRNVVLSFDAAWTGGAVKVTGVDQYGVPAVESVVPPGGGGTTPTVAVFAEVHSLVQNNVGVGTASAGIGRKLGVTTPDGDLASTGEVMGFFGGVLVSDVVVDAVHDAFEVPPGTALDGATDLVVVCGHYHNHA